ncbi:DUF1501 domain-containing protein [Effusibacillus pohliae]|uniref:DUF1501 domain-containing protein n=1 Tax=Effusibacillus pohliae TaxID=232270 RepID=UPI00037D9B97|nr:DUF1501 domain-containing protein [Effusibacillus pohliae]
MDMTRREFLKKSGLTLLVLGMSGSLGYWGWRHVFGEADTGNNILVVVQLSGGNDGLNTVIPYGIGTYYDKRPTLGIAQKEVLPLHNQIGLHPSLTGLKDLYGRGKLAIIQGVGYPNPNRSHFRSMEIWQTAVPDKTNVTTGWLGRYLDVTQRQTVNPLLGLSVGSPSKIFLAQKSDVPAIDNVAQFRFLVKGAAAERERRLDVLRKMYSGGDGMLRMVGEKGITALQASEKVQATVKPSSATDAYPKKSKFAENLRLIADLIGAGLGTKTYFTQLGGFDDHSREKEQHAALLKELDSCLHAFYQDLEKRGAVDRVAVLVYSEFGRRVQENASGGTDHGTAGPVFVLGGKVKGGLYGEMPSLASLDNGDLKYTVDFRSVYATLLDRWLNAPSQEILGGTFETLRFV